MDRKDRMIFVAGATGNQGGAVARHLLREGWRVRGLTRETAKAESQAMARLGAEMVAGDMEDRDLLQRMMQGCYGAFSVQNTWTAGAEAEIRQGRNMAEAAQGAGVTHFVYTSVGGSERNSGVPHFESKWQVEQHIRSLQMDEATILRPVWFMDNFASPWFAPGIADGKLRIGMEPDRTLQMIAVDDIGAFAAMAFAKPDAFMGREVEIAGDELTMPEVADAIGQAAGRRVEFEYLTPQQEKDKLGEDWVSMVRWFNEQGYRAEIPRLRQMHPGLMDFGTWLRQSPLAAARPTAPTRRAG